MGRRHPCLLLVGAPESAMQLLYNERHARRMVGGSAMAVDSHHTTKLRYPRAVKAPYQVGPRVTC